jgi:hypothetical protein
MIRLNDPENKKTQHAILALLPGDFDLARDTLGLMLSHMYSIVDAPGERGKDVRTYWVDTHKMGYRITVERIPILKDSSRWTD